mgnify:CR=1 FL=1
MTSPNKPEPAVDGRTTIETSAPRKPALQEPESAAPHTSLPVYVRFPDLASANIVRNWPQLLRLIEAEGFPRGIRLSANARAWEIAEVQAWLASRPPAGLNKIGPCSQRERSGRAQPMGKPRKAGCGSDASGEEAGHDR